MYSAGRFIFVVKSGVQHADHVLGAPLQGGAEGRCPGCVTSERIAKLSHAGAACLRMDALQHL
jgi:hypothetical protein